MKNKKFIYNNKELDFSVLDFWEYKYSSIYNLQEVIAEFLIEKALKIEKSYNVDYWTLFDILYRNKRIEIKQTAYYHPWNDNSKISHVRTFDIRKTNSNYEDNTNENKFERQNDIYIFCVNIGMDKESAYPLNINNWDFYIVLTKTINEICKDNKTISLNRVKKIANKVDYGNIKQYIDKLIEIDNNYVLNTK